MSEQKRTPAPEVLEAQKKLDGTFPEGRLNASDEGALAVKIDHVGGVVTMEFAKPTVWVGVSPAFAVTLAESLTKHARACGHVVVLKL